MSQFQAYHGVSGDDHQRRFDELSGQGYRLISIGVLGSKSEPRYAAVWVKRQGPEWTAVHGLSGAAYQAKFSELTANGYVPVLIAVSGSAAEPTIAGTFEKRSATSSRVVSV